jgi:hypothetical protein
MELNLTQSSLNPIKFLLGNKKWKGSYFLGGDLEKSPSMDIPTFSSHPAK